MPSASLLPSDLADLLGRGGTVVTGNQRAARTLRLAFDRLRRADGVSSWQPPAVFAWDTWISSLYRQLQLDGRASRILLNRTQELQVWRTVIEADNQTGLQAVDSLAAMAADAWQQLCAYRGQKRLQDLSISGDLGRDTLTFQRWRQAFIHRLKTDDLVTAAELEGSLAATGELTLPSSEIRLVGFDRKTPAQQVLIDALRKTGVRIEEDPVPPPGRSLHLAAAETPEAEIAQAAHWIRGLLIADPQANVAVIAPGLAKERREIDRIFRRILAPELEDITTAAAGPYEFSLGKPLASLPLVSTALELLRVTAVARPISNVSSILLSRYFATGEGELSRRAEFDAFDLRKAALLQPEINLGRLIALVSTSKRAGHLSYLLSQLRSLERTAQRHLADGTARQRSYADWGEILRELLESSGWPGSEPLDSADFQTRQKFDGALDELATLDFEGIRAPFEQALKHLEAILQRTLFAPESRDAPVQIMSPMEAAGSRFDAVVFLRASDLEWPVRPASNPLLSWRLRRELGMPGSDAARDFEDARRVTSRIAASAESVLFSYAKQTAESRQRPSAVLAGLRPGMLKPGVLESEVANSSVNALETSEENIFIPLANFTVVGGAGVLKAQAACGFRAFAEKRLWSTDIKTPEPGMDSLERGSIVHDALDHLWSDLRTQAALRALTSEQRAAQLSRSIDHSLRREAARLDADPAAPKWNAAYLDLQRERLRRLLTPWLELELKRAPFEVAMREESEVGTIGPLSLKIRIDRVDRLLDQPDEQDQEQLEGQLERQLKRQGSSILIDYKTGVATPSSWTTDRPDEPQLPLYAVLRDPESLAAVAFAGIRAGSKMGLQGYEAREDILPKASKMAFPDLQTQLEDWYRILTTLAEDFAEGDARVRPKSYPKTCKHCAQRMLCRLDAASLDNEDDEDAPEEDDA